MVKLRQDVAVAPKNIVSVSKFLKHQIEAVIAISKAGSSWPLRGKSTPFS